MSATDRPISTWFFCAALTVPVVALPGSIDPFELPRWLLAGLLPLGLVAMGRARSLLKPLTWSPVHVLLAYLMLFSLAHFLAAPSVVQASHLLFAAALWGLFNAFRSALPTQRDGAFRWLVALGTLQALYGIFQYAGWEPIFVREPWATGPRMAMAGTIGTPAIYGIFLGLAILAGLEVLSRSRNKLWPAAALGLMGVALLLNNTRSAIAGTAVGAIVLISGRFGKRMWVLLPAGLLAAGLFIAAMPDLRQRWMELADLRGTHSATIRSFYWNVTWEAIILRPLLGHGPGSFSRTYFDTQGDLLSAGRIEPPEVIQPMLWAHNDYLQIWLEVGLLGLILFVLCLGWAGWPRRLEGRWQSDGAAWLIAITALFLFPFFHPSTLLVILWIYSAGPVPSPLPNGEAKS